jgi:hypothetical protein
MKSAPRFAGRFFIALNDKLSRFDVDISCARAYSLAFNISNILYKGI